MTGSSFETISTACPLPLPRASNARSDHPCSQALQLTTDPCLFLDQRFLTRIPGQHTDAGINTSTNHSDNWRQSPGALPPLPIYFHTLSHTHGHTDLWEQKQTPFHTSGAVQFRPSLVVARSKRAVFLSYTITPLFSPLHPRGHVQTADRVLKVFSFFPFRTNEPARDGVCLCGCASLWSVSGYVWVGVHCVYPADRYAAFPDEQ